MTLTVLKTSGDAETEETKRATISSNNAAFIREI